MTQVAGRCKIQNGSDVRSDTAENFLADLIRGKLVTVVRDEDQEQVD